MPEEIPGPVKGRAGKLLAAKAALPAGHKKQTPPPNSSCSESGEDVAERAKTRSAGLDGGSGIVV